MPADQVVAQGEVAVYRCQNPYADSVGWKLNGARFVAGSLEGVRSNTVTMANGILYTLSITGVPEYNETVIVCQAFFLDNLTRHTDPVTLLIQGN